MKKTIKNSAIAAALLMSLGSASAVFAETASSTWQSTGTINFTENTDPTDPVDPNDPDQPGKGDPDDPGNGGTGNAGPLSLDYASSIDFGTVKTSQKAMTLKAKNVNPYLQVSDSRESGSWKLTAAMTSKFTNPNNGSVLNGAIMHWSNGEAVASKNNSSTAPTVNSEDVQLGDSTAQTFMTADESSKSNVGKGTWVERFIQGAKSDQGANGNVTLDVPGGIATSGTYTGEITWNLTDAA